MKIKLIWLMMMLWLVPLGTVIAQSDEPELRLLLRRTFGYQGGDSIQGSFSLQISGGDDLVGVDYLLDGELLASAFEAPYKISFSTGSHRPGAHTLQAIGTRTDGTQLESQVVHLTFITAEQSWKSAGRIAAWILGGVLIIMLVGMFGTGFLSRGRSRFDLGIYSSAGGAVCKNCELPFNRHTFSPNLLLGKLERCPHCGKIAIVPRANRATLEAAEARYREDKVKGQREFRQEEEDISQRLDDTRYEG